MSVYDKRAQPAYENAATDPRYAENKHILGWWTDAHDKTLATAIDAWHWGWAWTITDALVLVTPTDVIAQWKRSDPKCRKYAWHNVLMYFAIARADALGLTATIRMADWKVCLVCEQNFREDALPFPIIRALGMSALDFCAPCIRDAVLSPGLDDRSPEQATEYLRSLAELLGVVPAQGFGTRLEDLGGVPRELRGSALRLLATKPSVNGVKRMFGSWLAGLIAAGVLEDGTRRTARGTQCIAKDGHVCFSLGEKTIDDFLFDNAIAHSKENPYPEGGYRTDFMVGEVFIEYFGLAGDPVYDAKRKIKEAMCRSHGIRLISLEAKDLANRGRLLKLLGALIPE